jgi:hypothetical protein
VSDVTDGAPSIKVISKNATPLEIAAVTAVVTATLEELADAQSTDEATPSAWQRSQRSLRTPLHPGPGAWRGFSA